MYLLELQQYDTRQVVGIFKTEEEVKSWLEAVDSMKLHKETVEEAQFETYYLEYADLPDYQEVHWQNSQYILSRYSFSPDEGDIIAVYNPVAVLPDTTGLVPGQTKVSSYSITNEEAHDYITAFNEMKSFLRNHFKEAHQDVAILGQGSEDGEYLMVDGRFICHVEGALVDQWLEKVHPRPFSKQIPFYHCKYTFNETCHIRLHVFICHFFKLTVYPLILRQFIRQINEIHSYVFAHLSLFFVRYLQSTYKERI